MRLAPFKGEAPEESDGNANDWVDDAFVKQMRASNVNDEARDEKGRWTSGGGGGSSAGVYATPITPTSDGPAIDEKVSRLVERTALGQAALDYPDNKSIVDAAENSDSSIVMGGDTMVASSAKAMVAAGIAAKMDTKFDEQLLGTNGGQPVSSLFTSNDLWSKDYKNRVGPDAYSYFGTKDGMLGKLDWVGDQIKSGQLIAGDTPIIRSSLREEAIGKLVSKWAKSSNDHDAVSLTMQNAAVKEFNLTGTQPWDSHGKMVSSDQSLDDAVKEEMGKNGAMYQAFLRAQYDLTQQMFKDVGITSVMSYRGFDFSNQVDGLPGWADPESNDIEEGEDKWNADVRLRPLSSFSYSWQTGIDFDGATNGVSGAIISGQIPVARILSTAVTGLGCLGEREMVVLGGTDKWAVS